MATTPVCLLFVFKDCILCLLLHQNKCNDAFPASLLSIHPEKHTEPKGNLDRGYKVRRVGVTGIPRRTDIFYNAK